MSLIIFYIILLLEILTGLWCFHRSFKYMRKHNKKVENKVQTKEEAPNILIVIPCLREQDIIIQTLKHFLDLTNNFANVKILVVTTQKEEFEREKNMYLKGQFIKDVKNNIELQKLINKYNKILSTNEIKEILKYSKFKDIEAIINNKIKNSKTTNNLIEEFITQSNLQEKVYHFHYPNNEGMMADQLNYVLNNFEFKDEKNYYFSVYNADSIPNKDTIAEVIKTINENDSPKVIQQYSVPMSNWNELSNLMKGFAIYQSNFELRYGLINSYFPNKLLYTYVVGHGMYIRVDILKEIGGFETKYWCEDIYMSYVLRNKDISIYPIKTLEIMQSPQYLSILAKQNAVWFKTSFECLKIFIDVFKQNRKVNSNSIGWLIQRIRMNITWLGLPLAFLYTIIISILNKNVIMLSLSVLSYFVMILLEYGSTVKLIEKLTEKTLKNKIKVLISTIVATTISNIGPIYSLISRKKEKYKTVR
ncbi:MAG: glycosyltransferase family 2 protein [Clostridia bacterium]|nr:glycosyltransferase family 2 protein [Clostridia bacterium]